MATASGLPDDDLTAFEQAAENAALRAVRRIIDAVLRIVRGSTTVPPPVEGAPPVVALDPVADTAIVVPMWTEAATATIAPIVADAWAAAAAATAADFTVAGLDPTVLGPDRGAAYLSEASNRLVGIGDSLWQIIAQSLAEGMDAGEGIPELAARVQAVVPVTEGRATRIARTEVISASNAGSFAQAQALNDPTMLKIWQATDDDRTRETHREADGQTQPLLVAFEVGGFPLMFPGDPIGPPEIVINCRCSLTYSWDTENALTASLWDVEIANPGWHVIVAAVDAPLTAADGVTCPCGMGVTWDNQNGYQHDDGSVSHDGEFYGQSVSDLMAPQQHSGAMIALAPSTEDAYRLEVAEPAEDLHATLVYLGDDANLTPEQRTAILDWATETAGYARGPIVLDGFAISAFNPADPDKDTAIVLGLSGGMDGMGSALLELRGAALSAATELLGTAGIPNQHEPYHPHITVAYTDDPAIRTQLDHLTGAPVVFDHLRVAFGGDVYDIPLGQPMEEQPSDMDGPWDVVVAARGEFKESQHRRDAKGRFATMESRLAKAMSEGGDNPLAGFNREQLRRHGTTKLGLKFARGESEDSIRDKVAAALRGEKQPDTPAEPAAPKPRKAAKKAAPAKPTAPEPVAETPAETPEVPTVRPTASTAGRSRGKVEDLQPGDVTRKPLRVTRVIDTGGRYIYVRGMMAGHELEDRYERGQEIDFFRPTPEEIARDKEPREHFAAADDPEIKNNIFAKAAPVNVLEDLHQGRITHEEAATQLRDSAEYLRETADLNEEVGNADNASRMREAAGALDRLADEVGAKADMPSAEQPSPVTDQLVGEADRLKSDLDAIYERASTDRTVDGRAEAAKRIDELKLSAPQLKALAKELGVALPPRAAKTGVRDAIVTRFVGSRLASDALGRPAPEQANPAIVPQGEVSPRQQQVLNVAASPLQSERRQGGMMAITSLEDHADGRIIRKNVSNVSPGSMVRPSKDQYHAELLGALVADAVGLRSAATVESGNPGELVMEYVSGRTGEELAVFGEDIEGPLDSPDGQRLDLLDAIINNYDRNDGNWIIADDGRIVPIDHGMSFYKARKKSAPTSLTVPMSASELTALRVRLEGLRPEFDRLGRGQWLDDTLARFDKLKFAEGEVLNAATYVVEW